MMNSQNITVRDGDRIIHARDGYRYEAIPPRPPVEEQGVPLDENTAIVVDEGDHVVRQVTEEVVERPPITIQGEGSYTPPDEEAKPAPKPERVRKTK